MNPDMQDGIIPSMFENGVPVLAISSRYGRTATTFKRIVQAGIPAIRVLRRVDNLTDLFPFASLDCRNGSKRAAAHLYRSGARSIAFVSCVQSRPIAQERVAESWRWRPI